MKSGVPRGVRIVSLLLSVGGLVGVGIASLTQFELLRQTGFHPSLRTGLVGVFLFAFAFSIWIGILLWQGRRSAVFWSEILLALQIPVITIANVLYEFPEGCIALIQLIPGSIIKFEFEFHFGSGFQINFGSEVEQLVFGINVAALAALIYLMRLSRALQPSTIGRADDLVPESAHTLPDQSATPQA